MITTGIGFHDARINCEALALDETCIRTAAGEAAGDFDPQDRDGSVHRDADRIRARRGGDLIHDLFHAEGIRQRDATFTDLGNSTFGSYSIVGEKIWPIADDKGTVACRPCRALSFFQLELNREGGGTILSPGPPPPLPRNTRFKLSWRVDTDC
jgi:hypothetical protein